MKEDIYAILFILTVVGCTWYWTARAETTKSNPYAALGADITTESDVRITSIPKLGDLATGNPDLKNAKTIYRVPKMARCDRTYDEDTYTFIVVCLGVDGGLTVTQLR